MKTYRLDLLLIVIGPILFLLGGAAYIPATVMKPEDGYIVPDDVTQIDPSRMEGDWVGDLQLNWIAHALIGLGILAVIFAVLTSFRLARNSKNVAEQGAASDR